MLFNPFSRASITWSRSCWSASKSTLIAAVHVLSGIHGGCDDATLSITRLTAPWIVLFQFHEVISFGGVSTVSAVARDIVARPRWARRGLKWWPNIECEKKLGPVCGRRCDPGIGSVKATRMFISHPP